MRGKQRRFAYNEKAENVIQPGKPLFEAIRGHWNERYFKNSNPITIELACGRGEYTVGLAPLFPERNFIGVDIKGDRLWKGSKIAYEQNLVNTAFLRTPIHNLNDFFAKDEVDEIWLTFPDPRPKDRDERRRLTHERFIDMYHHVLQPAGWFRLKTDSAVLFDYTLDTFTKRHDIRDMEFTRNLATSPLLPEHHGLTTHYERLFTGQGASIKYLKCRFS